MASDEDKKKARQLVEQAGRLLDQIPNEPEHKTQLANKAIGLADEAITLDPENDEAWNNRGAAKHALEDHQGAIEDCSEAIRLNPKNDRARNNRSLAKDRLGDHQGAIEDCDKAIELNPDNAFGWNNRGMAKYHLGDHQGAITDFDEAIRLNPKNSMAWNNRGGVRHDLGDYHGAIADYDEAIELNPKNDMAWNNRGLAKGRLGDHHGAIADYDEAIRLNPVDEFGWSCRGVAKGRLGKYEESIKDLDEALRLNPDNEQIKGNRLAAENALRTEAQSEDILKKETEHLKKMQVKSKYHKSMARKNQDKYECFFKIILIIVGVFIAAVFIFLVWQNYDFSTFIENPFGMLPILSILVIVLSPFIWQIRLKIREANKHHILQEYYYSRYIIELYMKRYFTAQNTRMRIAETHMHHWMVSPPSDLLIKLDSKHADHSDIPQMELLKELSKTATKSPNSGQ